MYFAVAGTDALFERGECSLVSTVRPRSLMVGEIFEVIVGDGEERSAREREPER